MFGISHSSVRQKLSIGWLSLGVPGRDIPYVGTLTAAELVKRCSPLKVLTVTRHDYGSYYMRHTEVTAR